MLPDLDRRTPSVDPDDHHLFVSLNSAAENLSLAGAARGWPGDLAFDPANGGSLAFVYGTDDARESDLFEAIRMRQSMRADYDRRWVGPSVLRTLAEAAGIKGVDLVLITDRSQMDTVRDLVVEGNSGWPSRRSQLPEKGRWLASKKV